MPPKTKTVKEHVVFCDLYYKKVNNVSVADFFAIVNPIPLSFFIALLCFCRPTSVVQC